jgi:hypothetical protein
MNINVINEIPLQKERKFKGLFYFIKIPYSLFFVNHHDSKASLGDKQQTHVSTRTPPLLVHTTYLEYLKP